jgi:hypothetical protein
MLLPALSRGPQKKLRRITTYRQHTPTPLASSRTPVFHHSPLGYNAP